MSRYLASVLATLLLLGTHAPAQARKGHRPSVQQLQHKITRLKRQIDKAIAGSRFSKQEARRLTQVQKQRDQRDSGLFLKIDFHEQRAVTLRNQAAGFSGASGSPVFDVRDHRVIGLVHAGRHGDEATGPRKWTRYVTTMKEIRESVSTTLMMDQISPSMKPDHKQLLIEMMSTR
jgi:hypothetical protein